MSRSALSIRDAGPDDLDALLALWRLAGSNHAEHARPPEDARAALAHVAADPDERMLVGVYDGQVVAAIHLRRAPISPVHLESAVHTSYLLVLPEHRKHGFAHAMLEAAVTWAEEKDTETVTAIVSGDRETNRFFARLGLADIATVRAATTTTLRHRLTPTRHRPHPTKRNLAQVLAERRASRRNALGAVEAERGEA